MAFLLPENIPTRSDLPERLQSVARDLRDLLPDDAVVWLEGLDQDRYLLLLDPSSGVYVVDCPSVKSRRAVGLLGKREVEVSAASATVEARWSELKRLVERETSIPDLPVNHVLAMPVTTRDDLASAFSEAELEQCWTSEDFESEEALLDRLRGWTRPDMTALQVDVVRGLVNPTIVIEDFAADAGEQLVFRPPEDLEEDFVRVLDRAQERLAMYLGDGYRVIRGVAGSGKTLVLTTRARYLAENFPSLDILITCYNVVLAGALRQAVEGFLNINVRHIDSVAWSVLGGGGGKPDGEAGWQLLRDRALRRLVADPNHPRYDVVLVDEAQDFDNTQLQIAYELLRPGRESFVVAIDNAQNIYRRRARWNPPGQTARGRTSVLHLNYRNTKEILEFALRFLTIRGAAAQDGDYFDDPDLIVPPESSARHGDVPRVVSAANIRAEASLAADEVRRLLATGVKLDSIALIYGSYKMQTSLFFAFQEREIPYFCVSCWAKNKRMAASVRDVARSSTPQSLKGLEFPYVVLTGVNDMRSQGDEDEEAIRRLVYVAMTRATDHLFVTVSGSGPIGRALLQSTA